MSEEVHCNIMKIYIVLRFLQKVKQLDTYKDN